MTFLYLTASLFFLAGFLDTLIYGHTNYVLTLVGLFVAAAMSLAKFFDHIDDHIRRS